MMTKRATYSAPRLKAHGSVEKITKGNVGFTATDSAFPAHTPTDQLTFS